MEKKIRLFDETDRLKIGLAKSRKKILDLLKVRDMTISQIAEALERDQSTVYRHIKKLEEAGFIEVKGEKKEYHIPERIYGRTADIFLLAPEEGEHYVGMGWKKENIERCLTALQDSGLECRVDEETIDDLTELLDDLDRQIAEYMDNSFSDQDEIDFFSLIQSKFLAALIMIENDDFLKEKIEDIANRYDV